MPAESQQPSLLPRRSAVRSGLATGFSILAVSGSAVVAGAYLAQKFGRDAETDGFLAAYGVYLVIVLAAQAFRLVLVPDLTRASAEDGLTAEFYSYVAAFLVLAVPACLLTIVLAPALDGKCRPPFPFSGRMRHDHHGYGLTFLSSFLNDR